MWTCVKCSEKHEDTFDDCWNCGTSRDGTENPAFRRADDVGSVEAGGVALAFDQGADVTALPTDGDTGILREMALSTTPIIPGCRLERTLGIVCGETVITPNVLDDMIASLVDVVGGRLHGFEERLESARQTALVRLAERAKALGATAVVGIKLDHEGLRGRSLMVCASGTAVVAVAENQPPCPKLL